MRRIVVLRLPEGLNTRLTDKERLYINTHHRGKLQMYYMMSVYREVNRASFQ